MTEAAKIGGALIIDVYFCYLFYVFKIWGDQGPSSPPLPSPLIGVQGAIHQPIENLLTTNLIKSGLRICHTPNKFQTFLYNFKSFFDLQDLFLLFFSLREKGKN